MAEIFISYKSERRAAAAHLAKILEHYGYKVWFDYDLVKGDDFADEIDRRLREAKALVVLWCKLAVQSVWVRREAALGTRLGILVPAMIEPCELRVDFASDDYTDLSDWNGAPLDRKLFPLLDGIAHRVGLPPQLDFMAMRVYEEDWHRFGAPSLGTFALGAPAPALPNEELDAVPASHAQSAPGNTHSAPSLRGQAMHGHAISPAAADWKLIEHSTDARDFRAFIEEHNTGFLARKAQHRLDDLAEEAFTAAGRDRAAIERFLKTHFDSAHAGAARDLLAGLMKEEERQRVAAEHARREQELKRQEKAARLAEKQAREARHQAEGRVRIIAAFSQPEGQEWFLPGAGKEETFKDLDGGPEMVVIPPGSFLIGSPLHEPGHERNEGPQCHVTIPDPFAMGRFAVTFAEWSMAQNDKDWRSITGMAPRQPKDEAWGQSDRPVIDVDWNDAKAFVKWLCGKTGPRLPAAFGG